jgi:pimeloyl-ACP methyl ester carboxylesterase
LKDSAHFHSSDLRGVGKLAVDATLGITDLVEALHHNIASVSPAIGKSARGRTKGITGLVYGAVRGVTGLVGSGIDAVLARLVPVLAERRPSAEREAVLAALNGVLGDHLAQTDNPLAIRMQFRRQATPLVLERAALAAAIPDASSRVVVLVHGLCLNDRQWKRKGHDHGAFLARKAQFTPVYLHYNTGLHISTNGREFAGLLEKLLEEWPVAVERFAIVGHSMGGLVTRSACQHAASAGLAWLPRLESIFFLGTPHFGAPLERGGYWIDLLLDASPYTAPFARLGRIRSAGITDLRHGAVRDEDWDGHDRFARRPAPKHGLALPSGVRCHALAATTGNQAGSIGDRVAGDGLVPLASALGRHREGSRDLGIPLSRQWVGVRTNHLDLLSSAEAGERIRRWLDEK